MSLRRTAALALAVILVGGFYYWYEVEGSKRRRTAEEQRLRLLDVEPEAVSAVTLRRGGTTLKAARRDSQWYLVHPLEARADQEAVSRLVEAASRAKKVRVIDEKPKALEPFGLGSPRLLINLETDKGEAALAIGSESPTGRGVYARAGPEGPVVLLERQAERAADKELLAFRDRSLFDTRLGEVTGVRLLRGSEAIVVEKVGEGAWALKEPVEAPADSVAVEDLLRALTTGEVQEFIDDPKEDPEAYGLASPRAALTLSTRDGRSLGPLRLGKAVEAQEPRGPAPGRLYARRGEAGPVLLLEDKVLKALPSDATALRDRRLLVYELDDVERLEVASPEETVVVERRGERGWAMTRPLETAADDSAVRNFLWDLKALRAREFLDGADPAEARFGLGPSASRYALSLKGRAEPIRLEVGGEAKEGAERYVRASLQKGLVTVEAEELKKIKATGLTLRDRSLLAFETEDVRRLEVVGPKGWVELWKDGPDWRLKELERRELEPGPVTSLLWSLKQLKFSGVVEEERSGEPAGEILLEARLWTDSEEPVRLAVLRAAGEAGGEPVAFGSAKPGLYTVAAKDLKEVEEEVDRLLTLK